MKARPIVKRLRPLPAVMVLVAGLLVAKGFGLAVDARAAAAQPQNDSATSTDSGAGQGDSGAASPRSGSDPSEDDNSGSAAEVDVLTSLSERRVELDSRAKALEMRANLIAAAEKRVDSKIADLKTLQSQIQSLLGQRDAAQEKQIANLVKVYSAMKPRDAARIFNSLDEAVMLEVTASMKPDVLAAIMGQMNPQQAQALTVKLVDKLKLPQKADLPSQLAAATPGQPAIAAPQDTTPQAAQQQPTQQQASLPQGPAQQSTPPATSSGKSAGKTSGNGPASGG